MGDDVEAWSLVSRVFGCGSTLVILVVAVAAVVAAARIKRSPGTWAAAVALFGMTFVAGGADALGFLEDSIGPSPWLWVALYFVDVVCTAGLIVGLALIRPTAAPMESAS